MFAVPSRGDIRDVALSLSIHLSAEDVDIYRRCAIEQLDMLDEFVQSRSEQLTPPMLYRRRDDGRRPGPDEDRYNPWLWKREIGGGSEGLLTGKRVSFKDHIPIAGVPLNCGSLPTDGFVPVRCDACHPGPAGGRACCRQEHQERF
jgi:amidase